MKARIAGVKKHSLVDGPGVRYAIFFQGCEHACKGCHNPDTWDPRGGCEADTEALAESILNDKYIDGVTISGGDPFLQPDALKDLLERLEQKMNVWVYTGFTFEQVWFAHRNSKRYPLHLIDVLVDGKFEESRKGNDLYRGSSNQRLIDVKASLSRGGAVLWQN